MKHYFLLAALALCGLSLQSCDDDDDNGGIPVSAELQNALTDRHPGAQRVEWETEGAYFAADFYEDNLEKTAWFAADGAWQMTETELRTLDALPAAVRTAFQASAYASWRVDDVDRLERRDGEDLYVIDVEQANQDVTLVYSADGVLVKELVDTDGGHHWGDYLPSTLPQAVTDFIAQRYPGARIMETDQHANQTFEVDIIHDNRGKELLFSQTDNAWIQTSWDVALRDVPAAVTQAAATALPDYRLDDADYVETPDGDYYLLELERGGSADQYLRVTADGTVL